jgi:hypothetical protein
MASPRCSGRKTHIERSTWNHDELWTTITIADYLPLLWIFRETHPLDAKKQSRYQEAHIDVFVHILHPANRFKKLKTIKKGYLNWIYRWNLRNAS